MNFSKSNSFSHSVFFNQGGFFRSKRKNKKELKFFYHFQKKKLNEKKLKNFWQIPFRAYCEPIFSRTLFGFKNFKMSYGRFVFSKKKKTKLYPALFYKFLGPVLILIGFCKTYQEAKNLLNNQKVFVNGKSVSNFKYLLRKADVVAINSSIYRSPEKSPSLPCNIVMNPKTSSFVFMGFPNILLMPSSQQFDGFQTQGIRNLSRSFVLKAFKNI